MLRPSAELSGHSGNVTTLKASCAQLSLANLQSEFALSQRFLQNRSASVYEDLGNVINFNTLIIFLKAPTCGQITLCARNTLSWSILGNEGIGTEITLVPKVLMSPYKGLRVYGHVLNIRERMLVVCGEGHRPSEQRWLGSVGSFSVFC